MKRNLLFIGLGPHAQAVQYRFLDGLRRQGTPLRIRALVELEDRQADVEQFLQDKRLQPDNLISLPVADRNSPEIHPKLLAFLEKIKHTVDGVLICTEPKAHKKYILWALQNNIDVLADKPLTAPLVNEQGPSQVERDFADIEAALSASTARLCLMTNKRVHAAYQAVYQQLREFVTEYNVPLTHAELLDGGGMWNFPLEFETRENHPYKYGYGILLHTGFHYVDLLLHYQSVNHLIGFQEDEIKVHAFGVTPFDAVYQFPQRYYEKLFPKENFGEEFAALPVEKYKTYGITDLVSSLQFLKEGRVVTQSSLSLLQHTLSARAWRPLPDNLYLKNGRLTQNQIHLFCGPLLDVRLTYCQPDTLAKDETDTYILEVQRNTALVGGKSYVREEFTDRTPLFIGTLGSLNLSAKFNILGSWVTDTCAETDVLLSKRTAGVVSRLFEEVFARRSERFGTK